MAKDRREVENLKDEEVEREGVFLITCRLQRILSWLAMT